MPYFYINEVNGVVYEVNDNLNLHDEHRFESVNIYWYSSLYMNYSTLFSAFNPPYNVLYNSFQFDISKLAVVVNLAFFKATY